MSAQKPSVPTKKGKHKGKGQTADTGNAIADCHKVVSDILADGKSDDVESCDVKKGKSLLSKRRRVYNVVSDDDDTVADDNKVYVADNVVNDKKKSIKRATKGKAIAGCDKVFSDVADAGNYVKPVDSTVKCDKVESGDVSYDAKKSKSLSSKGRRVLKGVSVDLTADDNKVIKPDDGFSKFENTELKSVDVVYKCDKEYEDVPKKRTPSSRQRKIVNRFGCYYSIQENVESLQLIPQQQPGVEEEQLDMQIMPIEDHVDASATLERLSNFKASQPDSAVVSEDVAGILLCDNVSDGSPSIDTNSNEIVQKVKTKSIISLLDPKLKESTGVYEYKVIRNCLNEEVVADTTVATGSGDQSLKDDCPVNSNQVCNYQNNVASFQEEVVGDIAGSGDQSLKYDCPVNSNQVCNYQNNVALFQEVVVGDTTVPTGSGENLKDGCPVNSNEVRNYQNNGGDQSLKDGCHVNSNKVCNYQNN
ncbi:hypothetical protein Tco_0735435, partial [Tanacetum coccineum]